MRFCLLILTGFLIGAIPAFAGNCAHVSYGSNFSAPLVLRSVQTYQPAVALAVPSNVATCDPAPLALAVPSYSASVVAVPSYQTVAVQRVAVVHQSYGYNQNVAVVQVQQRNFGSFQSNSGINGLLNSGIVQNAIQGGITAQLSGGKFGKGALAGAALGALSGGNGGFGGGFNGGGFGGGGGGLIQNAITGGITAKLSGGKLGKGALAGAALGLIR